MSDKHHAEYGWTMYDHCSDSSYQENMEQLVRRTYGVSVNTAIITAFASFSVSCGLFVIYYQKYHPRLSYLSRYDCIKELSFGPKIAVENEEIRVDLSPSDDDHRQQRPQEENSQSTSFL